MSDFRPMTECKGFNMERVLLKNKNGYMITAYFKDGMLQSDGDKEWTHPIAWDSFIRLQDLANGVNTSDSGLHLQRVTAPLLNYSFRDKNGEIQHCQVDAKNAEIMIGNMLEQLNKVNRFIAEFTSNGR